MSTATSTLDRPAGTSDRRVRVLLVEDTDAVRRAVALGLRSSGFEVTAVRGAEDALAVYSAVQPEVIITDLAMPGMDGFELIATLRVRGRSDGLPPPPVRRKCYLTRLRYHCRAGLLLE